MAAKRMFKSILINRTEVPEIMKTLKEKLTALIRLKCEMGLKRNCPSQDKSVLEPLVVEVVEALESQRETYLAAAPLEYWLLKARFYHMSQSYLQNSINAYYEAVALNVNRWDIWNELGECHLLFGELLKAKECFKVALEKRQNSSSLRNMSIVNRKLLEMKPLRKAGETVHAIELAQQAINMNKDDGDSWNVLGNAYLTAFYNMGADPVYACKAINAYKHAQRLTEPKKCGEIHFRKFIAYKCSENYNQAMISISRALNMFPNWKAAGDSIDKYQQYLADIYENHRNNGYLKQKRFNYLQQTASIKALGPYLTNKNFQGVTISQLKKGYNRKKVVYGKVIWCLQPDPSFPYSLGIVDNTGNTVVICVFNLREQKGLKVGNNVAIPEPHVAMVNFNFGKESVRRSLMHRKIETMQSFCFWKIRVNSPKLLLINGKYAPGSYHQYMEMEYDVDEEFFLK